jgi:PPOX class probable F420-dependent enzyme
MSDAARNRRGRARPRARPVPGRRLPGERRLSRLAARRTPVEVRQIALAPRRQPEPGDAPGKHSLLVTFRRDGAAVPTPVWAAPGDARLYVRTVRGSGKVKRLLADPRVLLAPCTMTGSPLGAPFEAFASVLAPEDEGRAERALREAYGRVRAAFEWTVDLIRVDMCYLEIMPQRWGAEITDGGAPGERA